MGTYSPDVIITYEGHDLNLLLITTDIDIR